MAPIIRNSISKVLLPVGRNEQSSSGSSDHQKNCRMGILGMHLKMKSNSSSFCPSNALPKHSSKPNPMKSIQAYQGKKAVVCGVSYKERKFNLKGTINDVNNMRSLLIDHCRFPSDSICVLTEEERDPDLIPTKENMQKAMKWLVEDCQAGYSLVFYFSGHGLRQPAFDQDELDGFDETLCPLDFMTPGMIINEDLNTTIVKPLKKGVTLHVIIDACHSGTLLDLEHVYNRKTSVWEDNRPPSGAHNRTSGGLAICFSACADDQLAADTIAFTGKEMTGAMTYNFVQTVKNNHRITYGDLLNEINAKIEFANKTRCLNIPVLKKMCGYKFIQETQLSSTERFDVNSKEFKL